MGNLRAIIRIPYIFLLIISVISALGCATNLNDTPGVRQFITGMDTQQAKTIFEKALNSSNKAGGAYYFEGFVGSVLLNSLILTDDGFSYETVITSGITLTGNKFEIIDGRPVFRTRIQYNFKDIENVIHNTLTGIRSADLVKAKRGDHFVVISFKNIGENVFPNKNTAGKIWVAVTDENRDRFLAAIAVLSKKK